MLAPVERMPRTRHVLRVFDVLRRRAPQVRRRTRLVRPLKREEQVAGAGAPDLIGRESMIHVILMNRIEVRGFEAYVHKADGRGHIAPRIQLDELTVVDLEERLRRRSARVHRERLFKAELMEEGARAFEVGDADGHVRDAGKVRCRRWSGCRRLGWRGKTAGDSDRSRAQ